MGVCVWVFVCVVVNSHGWFTEWAFWAQARASVSVEVTVNIYCWEVTELSEK